MTRFDWLEFSVKVLVRPEVHEAIKEAHAASLDEAKDSSSALLSLGFHRYAVQPHGCRLSPTQVFKYRLVGDFCELLLTARPVNNDGLHLARVICRGGNFALCTSDNLKPRRVAEDALNDLGHWEQEKLARVDECHDFYDLDSCELMHAIEAGHYATRAKRSGYWKSNGVTHYFGKAPNILLRVYDKRAETYTEGGPWTRAEWQVGREPLRELGAATFAEYLEKRSQIVAYLTNWFRLTDGPPDELNSQRTPTHRLWSSISSAVAADRVPERSNDSSLCAKAAVGSFLSYLARRDSCAIININQAADIFADLLRMYVKDQNLSELIARKTLS